jgi:hypothetical protein
MLGDLFFIRCPYCHRAVLRWLYASHEAEHTALRSDGQQTEHVTAAPAERYQGSLEGIPQGYRHTRCGVVTGMPEEIIRTYLVNPFMYNDGSFCCGCSAYVDSAELFWQETGECVQDYLGDLRLEYLRSVLGMELPDWPASIVVTPRAIRKVQALIRQAGIGNAYLLLGLPAHGSTAVKLDLVGLLDRRLHEVIMVSGIAIAVLKRDVARTPGIVIDYQESPQPGFAVARLYKL